MSVSEPVSSGSDEEASGRGSVAGAPSQQLEDIATTVETVITQRGISLPTTSSSSVVDGALADEKVYIGADSPDPRSSGQSRRLFVIIGFFSGSEAGCRQGVDWFGLFHYDTGMKSILIRNLDEQVLARLKRLAASNHRSLQGELHRILRRASRLALRKDAASSLSLITVSTGRRGTFDRDEVYGDDGR